MAGELTTRDRFLKVLNGEIPDRVPIVAFVDKVFLSQHLGRPIKDLTAETISFCRSLGFDPMVRVYCVEPEKWETDGWRMNTYVSCNKDIETRTKRIETPGGVLQSSVQAKELFPGVWQTNTVEHLVKTPKDLELMRQYHVTRPPVITGSLKQAMKSIGENGIVVTYGGGAAHTGAVLNLRGLERLTTDALDNPGFYRDQLEWAIEYESGLLETLKRLKPDLCQIGGLMAQGNFVGPKYYQEFVLPFDQKYIDKMHRLGLKTVYHNCGFSRTLLELYKELGTDAFETFPPPPLGDGDIRTVKKTLGEKTVLIGNIDQTHLLREASPKEVYNVVKETVLAGKSGGKFILMTSDEIFPDTPLENLRAMAEAGKKYGRYDT